MKDMIPLLLAEDEADLALIVKDNLQEAGFDVLHVDNGGKVYDAYRQFNPAIILLDVMMPEVDGFSIAQKIREEDLTVPILFLTARTSADDVVNAFHIGANDYLRKPFNMQELIARTGALVKRAQESVDRQQDDGKIKIATYMLDPIRQHLFGHGQDLSLSYREAVLLQMLCKHKNQVLSREEIIHAVWPNDRFFNGRSLDVYVSRLRSYLKDDKSIAILNVRAKGYKLMIGE